MGCGKMGGGNGLWVVVRRVVVMGCGKTGGGNGLW